MIRKRRNLRCKSKFRAHLRISFRRKILVYFSLCTDANAHNFLPEYDSKQCRLIEIFPFQFSVLLIELMNYSWVNMYVVVQLPLRYFTLMPI